MSTLAQLVYILVVGTLCQVVGWRLKVPSILLLLVAGILSGPVFQVLNPDQVLGPVLMPFVELAVAVILFEGGLSLKKGELGSVGPSVIRLISVGVVVSWVLLGTAAHFLLGLGARVSALIGAVLVVSGPTVVIPLLRAIRARAPVEPILRWEGILIDPIGVVLAVLVAEVFDWNIGLSAPWHIVTGIFISLATGLSLGWIGAAILRRTIGRHTVPDQFIVPICLAVLFGLVLLSNMLHEQSGLLTSTMMGLFVASSKKAWVQTIEDFIGHTQGIFIGILFMILAARLDPRYVEHVNLELLFFIVTAVVFVRPAAVFISTLGTTLSWREKMAISSLAPRGIVSAALASSLGASLAASGFPGVENIVPHTFATIIGSVLIYGMVSPVLFTMLGVQQSATEGVLFVGAGPIAVAIGKELQEIGFRVAFVDTNEWKIKRAQAAGLKAYRGSILSDGVQADIDMEGIGNLLAFTPNDEANSLAAVEFKHLFGSGHVFQVALAQTENSKVGGRLFGDSNLTLSKMEDLWVKGYRPYIREVAKERVGEAEDAGMAVEEYLLGEIEGSKLYLACRDNLRRATKPDRQLVYSPASQVLLREGVAIT